MAALISLLKCCERRSRHGRKFVFDKLILEEEGKVLKEILRTAAKEKLKEAFIDKIGKREWKECFNVTEDLIKSEESTLSEQQNQKWEEWKRKRQGWLEQQERAGPSLKKVKKHRQLHFKL